MKTLSILALSTIVLSGCDSSSDSQELANPVINSCDTIKRSGNEHFELKVESSQSSNDEGDIVNTTRHGFEDSSGKFVNHRSCNDEPAVILETVSLETGETINTLSYWYQDGELNRELNKATAEEINTVEFDFDGYPIFVVDLNQKSYEVKYSYWLESTNNGQHRYKDMGNTPNKTAKSIDSNGNYNNLFEEMWKDCHAIEGDVVCGGNKIRDGFKPNSYVYNIDEDSINFGKMYSQEWRVDNSVSSAGILKVKFLYLDQRGLPLIDCWWFIAENSNAVSIAGNGSAAAAISLGDAKSLSCDSNVEFEQSHGYSVSESEADKKHLHPFYVN